MFWFSYWLYFVYLVIFVVFGIFGIYLAWSGKYIIMYWQWLAESGVYLAYLVAYARQRYQSRADMHAV